jgi:DNA-binding beta-propeller fold protein YncE
VVDAVNLKLIENLPMRAHPEAQEIDPVSHRIFVNVADAAEVAVINGSTHKVIAQWPLPNAKDNVPFRRLGPVAHPSLRNRGSTIRTQLAINTMFKHLLWLAVVDECQAGVNE